MKYSKRCINCGESFETNNPRKKTCSDKCSYLISLMKQTKFYNDGTTDELRLERLSKLEELAKKQQFLQKPPLDNKCFACNRSSYRLLLHHVSYYPQETVTLCSSCHAMLHSRLLDRKKCSPIKVVKVI